MAIIHGFVGGAGKGIADASMMLLQNKLQAERDEADFLRNRELKREDRTFTASENAADRTHRENLTGAEIMAADRRSQQQIDAAAKETDKKITADAANTKLTVGAKEGGSLPADAKTIEYLVGTGWKRDVAEKAVLSGTVKVINNADGTQTLMKLNKDTGAFDIESSVVPGDDVGAPAKQYRAGEMPPNEIVTKAEIDAWRKNDPESNDGIPWNSKSNKEVKAAILADRKGQVPSGGLINSQRETPPTSKAVPQSALDYLEKNKNDPKIVKQFEAKYGYNPYK